MFSFWEIVNRCTVFTGGSDSEKHDVGRTNRRVKVLNPTREDVFPKTCSMSPKRRPNLE